MPNPTEPVCKSDQGCHRVVPCEPGCSTRNLLAEATSPIPAPVDRAAVYAEVADRLAADAEQGSKEGFTRIYRRSAAKQVREWAEELRAQDGGMQHPEAEEPTPEQIAREHVTTLHLIGEQLTGIESWMWEHLANVRDAAKEEHRG